MDRKSSEESRSARKAEKQAAADARHNQRRMKLEAAESAIARLESELRRTKKLVKRRDTLASHLEGFYTEIDKLTKGKALLPVTPLMVEQANDIIRDAKQVMTGDIYLDRIKQFVPAGDNPLYPDVLVVMRGVRESLERTKDQLKRRQRHFEHLMTEANTISVALKLNITDGEETVLKEQVVEQLGRATADVWFFENEDGFEIFDFDDLDTRDVSNYLSRLSEDDDLSEDDSHGEKDECEGEDSEQDEER